MWGGGAHYPSDFDVLVHPSRGILIFVCVCVVNRVVRHCTEAFLSSTAWLGSPFQFSRDCGIVFEEANWRPQINVG